MARPGPTVSTILALFDEGRGGLAAPAAVVAEIFRERAERLRRTGVPDEEIRKMGLLVSKSNLLHALDRLAKRGELSKVERPKGGAVYTRPRNLEGHPYARKRLEELPAVNIRRRQTTSPKRFELRTKRRIRAIGDEAVRRSGHDHRPNRRCPTCGTVTPVIRLAE